MKTDETFLFDGDDRALLVTDDGETRIACKDGQLLLSFGAIPAEAEELLALLLAEEAAYNEAACGEAETELGGNDERTETIRTWTAPLPIDERITDGGPLFLVHRRNDTDICVKEGNRIVSFGPVGEWAVALLVSLLCDGIIYDGVACGRASDAMHECLDEFHRMFRSHH